MDYDLLEEEIMMRFYRCNELSGQKSADYAAIAVDQIKKHLSTAEVLLPIPNQAMSGFSVSGAMREGYEISDTFKHLFKDGEVL